jgi:hypothetical protein
MNDPWEELWFKLAMIPKVFVMGLVLLITLALSGCQSSAPKWQGYRFDKHWQEHKL